MAEFKDLMKEMGEQIYRFFSHRILWLLVVAAILFYILIAQLFELQIVLTDTFVVPPTRTNIVTRPIPAIRGTIYDRFGRPLAINQSTFVVKMDPAVNISNEALLALALLFENNEEHFVDNFPISIEDGFEFTFTGSSPDAIRRQEHRWKDDMAVPDPWDATAEETWHYLRNNQFNIDPELSNEDARRIMNFRSMIFMERLLSWATYEPTPIIFAFDISPITQAVIEEQNDFFAGLFIDIETTRHYPAGHYVSHMVGQLRRINETQLANNRHLGYTADCLFGHAGLELSMEHFLRGTPGVQVFEVNNAGRRISAPVREVEPQAGDRIFLTIDLELQMHAFHLLQDYLTETLIRRMTVHTREPLVPIATVFVNFMRAHSLDVRAVLNAESDNLAYPMREYILRRFPAATGSREHMPVIQDIIIQGIEARRISPAMMLLTLIGTEQISDPGGVFAARLSTHPNAAMEVLIDRLRAGELTPQMMNTDPATGSLVLLCTHTGEVLAAVAYPSFDNNRLVNVMDGDYFHHINVLDPTTPMMNRPFTEARAPGSTFKMFTAAAALEHNVITPTTRIFDRVAFTAAGRPHLHCWHLGGHGNINVAQAIAVSCNYFFADAAHRLGNIPGGGRSALQGIERLNDFMIFFGLNDRTGVQIGEHGFRGYDGMMIASPEFKHFRVSMFNPFASQSDLIWRDGDTAQTSIGQGFNSYTTAQMARAMSVIANRGDKHELTLVRQIEDQHGNIVMRHEPNIIEQEVSVSDGNWNAIIEGMRLVTQPGAGGTAVNAFRGFPIAVAGKTGTAEEHPGRLSHTTFGAFAPMDDPQIAIFTFIPFGSTQANTQISAHISRDMIGFALGLYNETTQAQPLNILRQ